MRSSRKSPSTRAPIRRSTSDRASASACRSPTLENVVSNAERRALLNGEAAAVPRVSDIYASLPSLTGKIELEYEGELKGAETVARELVRQAVATVFDGHAVQLDMRATIDWFEQGGSVDLSDTMPASTLLAELDPIAGLVEVSAELGAGPRDGEPQRAAVADFVLEGLCALRKITRTEDGRLLGPPVTARARTMETREFGDLLEDDPPTKGKKKYYN